MRPRLLRALLCRWDVPVVCVEAGAGFGKSTVLAQAYQENLLAPRGADAWLTCELADSSASALLAGIVTTLGGSVEADVDVTAAAEAIWSASPVEVALFLDDVHLIEPGSPGEAALAALVEALPANGHIVLAGRRLPAVPVARLAAQDRLVRITEDDLRFTTDELREYADNAEVDVGRLEPAAGWPALVAFRASARSDDTRAFVLEEVVGALDPAVRRTLAIAALIGGGDAALLSAAARDAVDLDVFHAIPLVAFTPEGNVHVHALWSDLLVSELDDAQRVEARRAAAELLAARGAYGEAFELLAASGLWAEARRPRSSRRAPTRCGRHHRSSCADGGGWHPRPRSAPVQRRTSTRWSRGPTRRGRPRARATTSRAAIAEFAAVDDIANELRVRVRAGYSAWQREDVGMFEDALRRYDELGDRIPGIQLVSTLVRAICADLAGDHDGVLEMLRDIDSADLEPRLAYFPPLMRTDARLGAGQPGAALEQARRGGGPCCRRRARGRRALGVSPSRARPMVLWRSGGTGRGGAHERSRHRSCP